MTIDSTTLQIVFIGLLVLVFAALVLLARDRKDVRDTLLKAVPPEIVQAALSAGDRVAAGTPNTIDDELMKAIRQAVDDAVKAQQASAQG